MTAEPPVKESQKTIDTEQSRKFLTEFLSISPEVMEKNRAKTDKPKPTEAPEEKAVEPEKPEEKASEPAPEAKPEKKVKAKKAEKPVEPEPEPEPDATIDVGDLVDRTARAVAREVRRDEPKAKTPEKEPESDVPQTELRLQSHLEELEKLYPDEYRGVKELRRKFVGKLREYQDRWAKEHPGEEFNPDAEEHNEFYSADPMNEVSQEHLAEAIAETKVRGRMAEIEGRIQASEKQREVEPLANREGAKSARAVADFIDKEGFKSLLNSDGSLNQAEAEKLQESDPIKAPIVLHAVDQAAKMSAEMVKLYTGVTAPNQGNPLHSKLLAFGNQVEQNMLRMKPSEWKDPRGRRHADFLPSNEYWELSASERRHHWTFDEADMTAAITKQVAADAKSLIEAEEKRFQEVAKKRGFGVSSEQKQAATENDKGEETPEEQVEKPTSPSGRGAPNMAGPKGGTLTGPEKHQNNWLRGFLGKA